MAETKEIRLAKIHEEAITRFDVIQNALQVERRECLNDRRFYSIAGAQWEGPLWNQFENKPKIEVNKCHMAVMRIINDYRANRISVKFVSKDGSPHDKLADVCAGLYRADEQDSTANEAYDNAFEEAVGGGFGAWRLRADWADDEDEANDHQRIRIEPIYDADSSVFFDLDSKRQDKADAKYCYVITSMSFDAYKEEYDDDPTTWPKMITRARFDWCTPSVVYVAEYYRIEEVTETIRIFTLLDDSEVRYRKIDFERDPELEARLAATNAKETGQKRVKTRKVRKYLMSGGKVLEDCGYIAGKCIPVVPNYGKRWFIDNIERCMGAVRLARDAQRLGNMQRSRLAEIAALSPMEKPIFVPEQVSGVEEMWRNDNIANNAYLLVQKITDANGNETPAGPIGYTRPPQVAPAMAALLQLTEQDIRDVLGNPEGADKLISNVSGKAINAVSNRIDMQTFIYVSNFAKAMKRCGEIWLGMARDIYVEESRKMKAVSASDKVSTIELQRPVLDEDGAVKNENDLSEARFDVAVEVGPSTQSQRDSQDASLQALLATTKDPQTASMLELMLLMNLDGEGMSDVREYCRTKLVSMGVIKPSEEESQQMAAAAQQQQPDPQALLMRSMAEEASAKAAQARANTVYTVAKTGESRANTIETLAKVDQSSQNHAVDIMQRMNAQTAEQLNPQAQSPQTAPVQPQ